MNCLPMERADLIRSKEYRLSKIQIDLFNEVEQFMKKNELNRTVLEQKFGISRNQINQILDGKANLTISELVNLSLALGLAPHISFEDLLFNNEL